MEYTIQQFNNKSIDLGCTMRIEGDFDDPIAYFENEKGAKVGMTSREITEVLNEHPELLHIYMNITPTNP